MNALQTFINSKPCGFLKDTDIPELIRLDRLCQVLVRCNSCRFTCAAQDVEHLIKCVEASGDYVRDVSFPVGAMERAESYVPEQFRSEHPIACETRAITMGKGPVKHLNQTLTDYYRQESDCGGAFDGFQVTSDADPGL